MSIRIASDRTTRVSRTGSLLLALAGHEEGEGRSPDVADREDEAVLALHREHDALEGHDELGAWLSAARRWGDIGVALDREHLAAVGGEKVCGELVPAVLAIGPLHDEDHGHAILGGREAWRLEAVEDTDEVESAVGACVCLLAGER